MAEIEKLSVGKVLDKLRRNDVSKGPKTSQLERKVEATDEVTALESGNPRP